VGEEGYLPRVNGPDARCARAGSGGTSCQHPRYLLHRTRLGGTLLGGLLDHEAVEVHLPVGSDHGLVGELFRRFIPGPLFRNPVLDGLRHQSADFLALNANELAIIGPVELRAEIESVDSRVIPVQNEVMLRSQKYVVPLYDPFL